MNSLFNYSSTIIGSIRKPELDSHTPPSASYHTNPAHAHIKSIQRDIEYYTTLRKEAENAESKLDHIHSENEEEETLNYIHTQFSRIQDKPRIRNFLSQPLLKQYIAQD